MKKGRGQALGKVFAFTALTVLIRHEEGQPAHKTRAFHPQMFWNKGKENHRVTHSVRFARGPASAGPYARAPSLLPKVGSDWLVYILWKSQSERMLQIYSPVQICRCDY